MRKLSDVTAYFWEKFTSRVQTLLFKLLTTLSFLMLAFYLVYIVYYSTICFDIAKVVVGCLSLCVMIHLNKSL